MFDQPPSNLAALPLPAAENVTLLAPPGEQDVVDTVARWHDDTHPGAWPFCDRQPCAAVRRANGDDIRQNTSRKTVGNDEDSSW